MKIKLRKIRWAGHVRCMGEMRNVYTILIKKTLMEETTQKTQM